MNIILVSSRRPDVRTITVEHSHLFVALALMLMMLFALAALMNYALLRYMGSSVGADSASPFAAAQPRAAMPQSDAAYLRDSLDAMAARLGELQAQILRLDTLGERVARLAGFRPQDIALEPMPSHNDVLPSLSPDPLSFTELARRLDLLARQVDDRGDTLGLLDSLLTLDNVKKQLRPSLIPVRDGSYASAFGWRSDPLHGRPAFHDGIDLTAQSGTPIVAAAAGIVTASEYHPQYGNMVEIDHGSGLVTVYAHCSRRLVKVGDVVMGGATIGEVGSTGRATGPHLHFEVRHHGIPQNPARFLRLPG
jgi:murein DD-endopeptidase MepM/ murein hydrolase activator NlpD